MAWLYECARWRLSSRGCQRPRKVSVHVLYLQQVSDRRNGLDESRGIFLEGFGINRNMEKQGRLKETVIFYCNIEYIYIVLVCFVDIARSFEIACVCTEQHKCKFNVLTSDV